MHTKSHGRIKSNGYFDSLTVFFKSLGNIGHYFFLFACVEVLRPSKGREDRENSVLNQFLNSISWDWIKF